MSTRSNLLLISTLLLVMTACSGQPPVLRGIRSNNVTGGEDSSGSDASECADLRAQIRANQEDRREAPTTSTSSVIVQAAEGKADQRIDDLQRRLDSLDCTPEAPVDRSRPPPLQPAPGGPSTP